MALGVTFGFLFFMGLLLSPIIDPTMVVFEHNLPYAITMLAGGFILSSLSYRDLGNNLRRYNYLALPVSGFEKFLSMWLLTSFGWILLYTIIFTLYTHFANAVGQLIYSDLTFETFDPLGPFAIKFMKFYFVLQAIFLAGAAQFKGYAFPKTLLTLVVFGAICSGITYLIMKDMFNVDLNPESTSFIGMPVYQAWIIIQWLFWYLMAPVCWLITYMGLKEQEV